VLALWLHLDGFNELLKQAYSIQKQRALSLPKSEVAVCLQWDPDHEPLAGIPCTQRRALQLGLKPSASKLLCEKWIVRIEDITEDVHNQRASLDATGNTSCLLVPVERELLITDPKLFDQLDLTQR